MNIMLLQFMLDLILYFLFVIILTNVPSVFKPPFLHNLHLLHSVTLQSVVAVSMINEVDLQSGNH